MNLYKKSRLAVMASAVVGASSISLPLSAVAQESRVLEEVMVTAQKRSESVQDVPIAISAFSNEMIGKTGIDTVTDLIPMVPGLTGSTTGVGTPVWAIRGISTNAFGVGAEPSVAVFVDDGYIGRPGLSNNAFFDISRIEVVKGPQSSLFGRNASVGAISIITNKPEDENSLRLGLSAGNESQRGYDVVGNLAATDELAFRIAYHGTRLEGIYEDVANNKEAFTDRDDVRLMTRWTPSDDFEAILALNYSDSESNMNGNYSPSLSTVEPGEEFPDKIAFSQPDNETNEADGAQLRLTWDLSETVTLTSITDYRSYEYTFFQDVDGTNDDAFIDFALDIGTGGSTVSFSQDKTEQESISQELRLNGSSGDNIDWFVGVSYFDEEVDEITVVQLTDTALGLGLLGEDRTITSGGTESVGVYGDIKWSMSDALRLTTGIRWSRDDKDWCVNGAVADLGLVAVPTVGKVCGDESWDEITPRLVVDYAVNEDVMVFGSISRGYKGGGFNGSAADSNGDGIGDAVAPYDPEINLAYEVGLKSTLLDGSMQFNGSVFFNDYTDLQISTATLAGILTTNAAEVEVKGFELEATYLPVDRLTLRANYAYTDTEITEDDRPLPNDEGESLFYAPENTFSVSASYDQVVEVGLLNWFAMYNWQDEFNYPNFIPEDDYGVFNARVGFTPNSEKWDVAVAVDNIADEEYTVIRQDIGFGEALMRGMPRLWRVEFNVYF